MKTAYIDLIKTALNHGLYISVWDGEEWQVKTSRNMREIISAVKSVEEATLRFRDDEGNGEMVRVGSAFISAYGLEPYETVIDHSDNQWINAWSDAYTEYLNGVI